MGSSDIPDETNRLHQHITTTYTGSDTYKYDSATGLGTWTNTAVTDNSNTTNNDSTLQFYTADGTNFHLKLNEAEKKDITREVKMGTYVLERGYSLKGKNAELSPGDQEVKLHDVFIMDFVVYDSRSGITTKTNAQVAEGINRLIGKNVQFRHIDIKKNPYSMLGEVIGQAKIVDRVDKTNFKPYMQISFPLKLEAVTAEHVDIIQELMDLQKLYVDEEDYESRIGCSLGWVETAERFLPYEVSITPIPRCNECRSINQSGRLLSSTAEKKGNDPMTEHEKHTTTVQGCVDCEKAITTNQADTSSSAISTAVLNQKEDVIVSLNVENRELKAQQAELSEKLVVDAKKFDETTATHVAENKELKEKLTALQAEVTLAQTLPARTEIATKLLGLEGDDAKAKVEALSSMTAEALGSYHQDLQTVFGNREVETEETVYEAPIIAGAPGTTPTGARGKTAEDEAKAYMAEAGFPYGEKDKPTKMW